MSIIHRVARRGALVGAAALALTAGLAAAPANAAGPSCSTAKLIVPWGAGGGTDVLMRIITEAVNKTGAQPQLQVVNVPGQGGNKGAKEAVKAKADGCTLFAVHQSAITSYFTGRVDFHWGEFEPVALMTRTPSIFGANPDVPYDDLKGMIAYAKENPEEVLAGGTFGSTSQFVFLLLEDAAGIKFKHVPYDGTRERMTALLAKTIHVGEINLAATKKYIETGELKALAATMPKRHPDIPDVPTAKEQGVDLIYGTDRGILLPKGTDPEIVAHWVAAFEKAAKDPEFIKAIEAKGSSVEYLGGADYKAYMDQTFEQWQRIAKAVGIYKRKDG